jgi:hypothetical protein
MSSPSIHTPEGHHAEYQSSLAALPPEQAARWRAHEIRRTEEAIAWHEAQIRGLKAKLGRL